MEAHASVIRAEAHVPFYIGTSIGKARFFQIIYTSVKSQMLKSLADNPNTLQTYQPEFEKSEVQEPGINIRNEVMIGPQLRRSSRTRSLILD